jgi:arylsulfatase A-like enzyme
MSADELEDVLNHRSGLLGVSGRSSDLRDVTIPWIAWGKGVKPGVLQPSVIRTMDTASTVLWLLGVTAPGDWDGHAVIEAYEHSEFEPAGGE